MTDANPYKRLVLTLFLVHLMAYAYSLILVL